jgi:hypothetical protein
MAVPAAVMPATFGNSRRDSLHHRMNSMPEITNVLKHVVWDKTTRFNVFAGFRPQIHLWRLRREIIPKQSLSLYEF